METMPSSGTGFRIIDEYRNLAKHLDVEHETPSCKDMITLDQEVPQARSYLEEGDFYPTEVKMEAMEPPQSDLYSYFNNMFDNSIQNSSSGITATTTSSSNFTESRIPTIPPQPEFASFFSTSADSHSSSTSSISMSCEPHQIPLVSSTSITSSSSHSSPMLSSTVVSSSQSLLPTTLPLTSQLMDVPRSSASSQSSVKLSSYVTELGGSGCVVITPASSASSVQNTNNTDFLTGEAFTLPSSTPNFLSSDQPPPLCVPEDSSLNYLDLDKQPVSFYDDLKLSMEPVKMEPTHQMEGTHLEEAVLFVRDVIHHDCDALNVPYDPLLWNSDNVCTWVSWVCKKNGLSDVSRQAVQMDGRSLCSLTSAELFNHYGVAGESISTELDLWKAANSCFPDNYYPQSMNRSSTNIGMQMSVPQISSLLDPEPSSQVSYPVGRQFKSSTGTPCVSPAPSSGSQDSSRGGMTHDGSSDNSEDEYSSGDNVPTFHAGVTKLGRGHKQTIHLWQFLRELLLSNENHSDCIRWLDRKAGIFKIEDSKKVAFLWGQRKNRPAMNYDKLSRSVRQYYKKKIIKKTTQSKRLVYQFCPGYL